MTNPLQPDPRALGDAWRELVIAEREQVERLREWQDAAGDYYAPVAHHFADDPHRGGDEALDELRAISHSDSTWLDIGAGGGRYALPLALVARQVIAAEPSPGMREVLRAGMERYGIENIDVRAARWPQDAGDIEVDFTLVAHVCYDVPEINAFLDATERATRERCVFIVMDRAPSSGFVDLWQQVHGEPRHLLPGFRELLHLLLARGATPDVRIMPRGRHEMTPDELRENARRRLWVTEGSEKDRRLQALLDERQYAGRADLGFPTVIALIAWSPVHAPA
jgi:SAM-dependent methyltransferase